MSLVAENDWDMLLDFLPEEYGKQMKRVMKATQVLTVEPKPEVGPTPKEVIWTKNKTKLYRYISEQPKKHKTPLLMVYALINKPYVLDLTKGGSLIEYLVNNGFDVYLLDWGTPGYEDRNMKLDDFIIDYIPRAVKKSFKDIKS
jgi:polyhydroxyalkanoate synthase